MSEKEHTKIIAYLFCVRLNSVTNISFKLFRLAWF